MNIDAQEVITALNAQISSLMYQLTLKELTIKKLEAQLPKKKAK